MRTRVDERNRLDGYYKMGFIGNRCDEVVRLTSVKEEWWSKSGWFEREVGIGSS